MAMIQRVTAKIGNMRKAQDFVVYPSQGDEFLRVQSSTTYAKINSETGVGVFANVPGGAYGHHLITRGVAIQVPADILAQFKAAIPQKGDMIGKGVFVG